MKEPIFIIGNPRSGTTLFRLMLTCHPNIVIPPESGFAVWWHEKWKGWGISIPPDPQNLKRFLVDLYSSRKFETWSLRHEELEKYLLDQRPASYSDLISSIYSFYGSQRSKPGKRWGDKNNFYLDHIETLHGMFADAFFLHIVRDGRDVAASYMRLTKSKLCSKYAPNLPSDAESIGVEWARNVSKIAASLARMDPAHVCVLRYEDLIRNPEETLARVCSVIDESYSEEMLDYSRRNREERLEPAATMEWKRKTLKKPMVGEIGRFRKELSEEDVRVVERVANGELARYGYL